MPSKEDYKGKNVFSCNKIIMQNSQGIISQYQLVYAHETRFQNKCMFDIYSKCWALSF